MVRKMKSTPYNFKIFAFPFIGLISCALAVFMEIYFLAAGLLVVSLIMLLFSHFKYTFTKEEIIIQYPFGKEVICLKDITDIHFSYERLLRYTNAGYYQIMYNGGNEKRFYFQGKIYKNKKTTQLLNDFCSDKMKDL